MGREGKCNWGGKGSVIGEGGVMTTLMTLHVPQHSNASTS